MGSIRRVRSARRIISFVAVSMFVFFCFAGEASADPNYMMFLPFKHDTRVKCVQGNNGNYSHSGTLKYAYDFVFPNGDIFGTNLYSPVTGRVVDSRQGIPDYKYNSESSYRNNYGWGNTLLIKDYSTGRYVRIAHMKQGSCSFRVGDEVEVGQKIGRVGCSGFSSAAHLHIHMQSVSSNKGQSINFDFIEGDVQQGKSYYSELEANVSIIDAGGAVSMGTLIDLISTSEVGDWDRDSTSSSNKMTAGSSYTIEFDDDESQSYRWKFTPKDTGVYSIFARATSSGPKDEQAYYRLYSYDDNDVEEDIFIDQNESTENQLKYLTTVVLDEDSTYYIKLYPTTEDCEVTADSLHFYKHL